MHLSEHVPLPSEVHAKYIWYFPCTSRSVHCQNSATSGDTALILTHQLHPAFCSSSSGLLSHNQASEKSDAFTLDSTAARCPLVSWSKFELCLLVPILDLVQTLVFLDQDNQRTSSKRTRSVFHLCHTLDHHPALMMRPALVLVHELGETSPVTLQDCLATCPQRLHQ